MLIAITGPAKSGKSRVLSQIAAVLRNDGYEVIENTTTYHLEVSRPSLEVLRRIEEATRLPERRVAQAADVVAAR